jgi:hypothetical protein
MKYFLIGISIFIFLAHIFAILTSAYWSIWWYDDVLHFVGGLGLGVFAIWLIYDSKLLKPLDWPFFFTAVIITSFAVFGGVLWEFFEFLFDKFIGYKSYADIAQLGLEDTMADLFFDLLGGLSSTLIILGRKFKINGIG